MSSGTRLDRAAFPESSEGSGRLDNSEPIELPALSVPGLSSRQSRQSCSAIPWRCKTPLSAGFTSWGGASTVARERSLIIAPSTNRRRCEQFAAPPEPDETAATWRSRGQREQEQRYLEERLADRPVATGASVRAGRRPATWPPAPRSWTRLPPPGVGCSRKLRTPWGQEFRIHGMTVSHSSELRFAERSLQFAQFGPRGREQQGHRHRLPTLRGKKGGVQGNRMDVATGNCKPREPAVVQFFLRRFRRQHLLPDQLAFGGIGEAEVHHKAQSPHECWIQSGLHVRG